jgi:hypothetical protein
MDPPLHRKRRAQHLLGSRLARRAGHGNYLPAKPRARRGAESAQPVENVTNHKERRARRNPVRPARDHCRGCATGQRVGHEIMPVPLRRQRDEEIPRNERACVDRDPAG